MSSMTMPFSAIAVSGFSDVLWPSYYDTLTQLSQSTFRSQTRSWVTMTLRVCEHDEGCGDGVAVP